MSADAINNEPAFPIHGGVADHQFTGLTLRDYFAAQALPEAIRFLRDEFAKGGEAFEWSLVDDEPPSTSEEMAALHAYSMANAMLKARQA